MIKAHLGKADEQRSDPNGRLRKSVKLYRIERVHEAEAGAARSDQPAGVPAGDECRRDPAAPEIRETVVSGGHDE